MIPQLRDYFGPYLTDEATLLDLGSGLCDSPISLQLLTLPVRLMVHLDFYGPDLVDLAHKPHAAPHLECRFHDLKLRLPFEDDEFDLVVGLDVLEHLVRSNALSLLAEAERVASKRALWFVPLDGCPALLGPEDALKPGRDHKSIWHASDLRERGYTVHLLPNFHRLHLGTFDACFACKDLC